MLQEDCQGLQEDHKGLQGDDQGLQGEQQEQPYGEGNVSVKSRTLNHVTK